MVGLVKLLKKTSSLLSIKQNDENGGNYRLVHVTISDNRRTGQNRKHIEIGGYLCNIQLPIVENSFI